jgi:CubicO group peptidase (beta-lactamase class C family)
MSVDFVSQMRAFLQESLALWKVPGVGVGVIQGDEVLLCDGFGWRDVEKGLPATENTLFAIGSASKAFTTFDMGLLVDEGKLDWDKPVRDFMPSFQVHDPVASERLTPRDIVSHRVGLPRHDMAWYNSPLTRQEIFARLRHLEPNRDIRQTFQYNNLMFLTAGVLVEHLSGLSWEDFTRQRIFEPLGMRSSNFSVNTSQASDNFARPYREKNDRVEGIPFRNIDAVGPAGSINSCAADMVAWLKVHLNGGRAGPDALISSGNLEQMHSPQMTIAGGSKWKELLPSSYGLGWFIYPYRGFQVVEHGGNIDGFTALVALMPAEKIGVVVLTNLDQNALTTAAAYRAFDLLLGLEPVDWNGRFHADFLEFRAGEEAGKAQSAGKRVAGRPPAHPLEDYAGTYTHPGYGTVEVTCKDGQLQASHNQISYRVEPYHYEIFEFHYDLNDTHMKATFTTDVEGIVSRLSLPFEPLVSEIVFMRAAESRLRERAFLERLTGAYMFMGELLTVSLKGTDGLTATLPGRPAFTLVPYRGTTFQVDGLSGVNITFQLGENGSAESLELSQSGAVLTAKRVG